MIFVLIRHGHKSIDPPENPSLSAKGHEQSRKLLQLVQNKKLPTPTVCLYSDRVRTRETLNAIIEFFQPRHEIKQELNLRSYIESGKEHRARVEKLVNYYTFLASQPENKNQVIYACTHYDWVEEAMTVIDCDKNLNSYEFAGWAPGQYIEFQIGDDGIWHFITKGTTDV